jgi:serine/threonine-protein kinase
MASLHLARLRGHGGFEKLIAIKRILPHISRDERFVQMFLNEGKIAARLMHPNVCQVFELGDVDDELFLAMEYLEGVALDVLELGLPQDPAMRVRLAATVIRQACDGLQYAHELPAPVVHRDISPHNLFVTTNGICKLLDFGVSKVLTEGDSTRSGLVKGKLTYMPPEQLRGEQIDARVDVFSMGVVLWELLAGRRLFLRESDYLIMQAILEGPVPALRILNPAYHDAIDVMLARALARDRACRTPTIRALADELSRVAAPYGGPLSAAEIGAIVRSACGVDLAQRARIVAEATGTSHATTLARMIVAEPSVTHSVSLRDGSVSLRPRRSRRRWLVPVAIGALAVAAVAGALALRRAAPIAAVQDGGLPDTALEMDAGAAPAAIALDDAAVPDPPLPDAAPEAAPEAAPARVVRRPHAQTRTGYFSIDSSPYATIFVDGKRIDQTPLFKVPLASGSHRVRAVRADGRARTFRIRVAPGQHVNSGSIRW